MNFDIINDTALGEKIYTITHPTGLKICVNPKPGYSKCTAMFATRYGSIDSTFGLMGSDNIITIPDGTAHFLEHKLFDEQDGNVFDKFAVLGASANAFTSFNMTAYYFSATENVLENLEILIKFVQNPYFTPDSIAKEQGIIGQEIRMYDDNPNWRVFFNMLGGLYNNCYVKQDIAGTVETIAEIDDTVLYNAYNTFYHPSNMTLFVSGNIDPAAVYACAERSLKDIPPLAGDIKRIYPDEPNAIAEQYIEQRLSVAIPLFMIGFKDTDMAVSGINLLKKEIATKILIELLFGKSAPLYKKLYEQGLINESFGAEFSCDVQYAFSGIEGESKESKKVFDTIIAALNGIQISEQAYNRAKKVIWGEYVRSFNSTDNIVREFVGAQFNGVDYLDYKKAYDSITIDDIRARMASHFCEKNAVLSVVMPIL